MLDYHKTVISNILYEENNVCLLNIHKNRTFLYFCLIHSQIEQPVSPIVSNDLNSLNSAFITTVDPNILANL